jgi:hypothetical protein
MFVSQDRGSDEFCGLCWLLDGFQSEIPGRIHSYKLLAENGNPETSERFLAHAEAVMGLIPPRPDQDLHAYRLAREQLYRPSQRQFPVTYALWMMFGYQPPLAEPLTYKLYGMPDWEIAERLGVSTYNVQIRLVKATRLALRYVRNDRTIEGIDPHSAREDDRRHQKPNERRPRRA